MSKANDDVDYYRRYAITPERLDTVLHEQQGYAEHMLSGRPKSLAPAVRVVARGVGPDEQEREILYYLAMDFNDHDQKRAVLSGIGLDVYTKCLMPLAVALSTEAWVAPQAGDTQPRDHPQRRELIVCFASSLIPEQGLVIVMSSAPVSRDVEGRMSIGPWEAVSGKVESNLLQAFWRGFFSRLRGETPA